MVCRRREASAKVRAGAPPLGFLYDARSWGNYETAENRRTSEHAVWAIVGINAEVLAICLAPAEEDPRNHVGGIHTGGYCAPRGYGSMCCNRRTGLLRPDGTNTVSSS